ncbi:LytTR family DNA-binding domain-containing protein [Bacteroides sp. 519]|uniref:LytR/AlgR family response regulator transcription factor n=1 Tax=Bacteroides sp. 519 TaxID=2302937 RepID=UPI0013D0C9EC|nr:response regulator transcription factor [Bacteroides sp. 519]NDV57864.1 DNA-binding response regulator [Bacteroides sp. 519]
MKIKTIIIDDKQACIDVLQKDLAGYNEISVAATYTAATVALSSLETNMPDLLFLDMEMPDMNGLDFLQQMADVIDGKKMCVVFYTAYDYKMEAIHHSAFDYLLKPYKKVELDSVINRVKNKLINEKLNIKQEVENLTHKNGLIALNMKTEHLIVKTSQVVYFEYGGKENRLWKAILADNTSYPLKYSTKGDEILKLNSDFFQSSQHHIININYLFSIKNEGKKRYCVFYPPFNDLLIEISSKYYPSLRDNISFL